MGEAINHIVMEDGMYNVRSRGSTDLRVYRNRTRLLAKDVDGELIWTGHLESGDLIEARGTTVESLTVVSGG